MSGPRVVAYVPDLMDRSRITAVVPSVRFVNAPSQLASSGADVVVLDLDRPGALDVVPAVTCRIVGFGSHVERERLDEARAAGVTDVVTRSQFFQRVGELLLTPPG